MQTTGLSTTPILDRTDENRRQRNRLKLMKRGPGVFVYEGGHKTVDFIPTIKTRQKLEPVIDEDGAIVTDEQGRPQFRSVGLVPVLDHRGQHQMGGIPKRKINEHDTFCMPGWAAEGEEPQVFEIGVPQRARAEFAFKLRKLGAVRELEGEELAAWEASQTEPEQPKAKRGRKPKSEAASDSAS